MNVHARGALTGLATGPRTVAGLAVVTLTVPAEAVRQPDRLLAGRRAKALILLAAMQEPVMDKLPQTPSRPAALGLGMRLVTAAGCGVAVQRWHEIAGHPDRNSAPQAVTTCCRGAAAAGATAVLAALGASWTGVRWRAFSARRFNQDWRGAVVEDAAAVGLAVLGTRR